MLSKEALEIHNMIQSASAWAVLVGGEPHLLKIKDRLIELIHNRYSPANFPTMREVDVLLYEEFAVELFTKLWNDALSVKDWGEQVKCLLPVCYTFCLPKKENEGLLGQVKQ